jgi:hypothetical protein
MNKKEYFTIVTEILEKRFGKAAIKELQENASEEHKELKNRSKFEEWLADYCLDITTDLFDEYGVDFE